MEKYTNIVYREVKEPAPDCTDAPVMLTNEAMQGRYDSVLRQMKKDYFDTLAVHANLGHGSNFEYLTGFLPCFKEAPLILNQGGTHYTMMGNENLNKVPSARTQAGTIHAPYFPLPNQSVGSGESPTELLKQTGITSGRRTGSVGWKHFVGSLEDNAKLFDASFYVADVVREIAGETKDVVSAVCLFIGNKGARRISNVNEVEHYEFDASLASDCMLRIMSLLDEDMCETALGESLNALGQKDNVATIVATGKRFAKVSICPTENKIKMGSTISLTIGYKGGLSSRVNYVTQDASQLPEGTRDYVNAAVKLYYGAVVEWPGQIHCGMTGGQLYQRIDEVPPKAGYR